LPDAGNVINEWILASIATKFKGVKSVTLQNARQNRPLSPKEFMLLNI